MNVTFAPSALGTRNATLSFNDNAPGSPQNVSVSGTGATTTTTALDPLDPRLEPTRYGEAITLTAHVSPAISSTPTGNVTFYDGAIPLGTAWFVLLVTGWALGLERSG